MKLSRKNWLVKVYEFNFEVLSDWRGAPEITDLCHFMRIVLFWVPLKVLGITAAVVGFIFLWLWVFFVGIPRDLGMFVHYLVWSLIAMVFVLWYVFENHADRIGEAVDRWTDRPASGLMTVIVWLDAKKKRICPIVEIDP